MRRLKFWSGLFRGQAGTSCRNDSVPEPIGELARRLGVPEQTARAVEAIPTLPEINVLSHALSTAAPIEAIEQVRQASLEAKYGRDSARTLYLVLALSQVRAAEERRAAAGIDPAITMSTLRDLGVWSRHFLKRGGFHGITLEVLEWAQEYLRGNLVRFGGLQFVLCSFPDEIRVF